MQSGMICGDKCSFHSMGRGTHTHAHSVSLFNIPTPRPLFPSIKISVFPTLNPRERTKQGLSFRESLALVFLFFFSFFNHFQHTRPVLLTINQHRSNRAGQGWPGTELLAGSGWAAHTSLMLPRCFPKDFGFPEQLLALSEPSPCSPPAPGRAENAANYG